MSSIDGDLDFLPTGELPAFAQESVTSEYLKWVALLLQKPFYSLSESTMEAFASSRYAEQNYRVYVYAVRALGTACLVLTALPAILGAGFYWGADRISQKSFTYLKGTGKEISPGNSLNMMSLNACMLPGGLPFVLGGLPSASKRLGELENLIRKQHPPVLLLQEMGHGPSDDLYNRIKDLYPHFFVRIGPNPPFMESGLFVASMYPIEKAGFIPFDHQTNILRGAFWIETKEAVIFTSHMEHGEKNNRMRVDQLNKVKEKMAEFKKPCFLLGDLNIDRYVKGQYEGCGIAKDFFDPIPKNTPTASCKLEAVMRGTKIPNQPNEQDDYALLLKGEHADFDLNVEVIDTYEDENPYDAISDHKAIKLTAMQFVQY